MRYRACGFQAVGATEGFKRASRDFYEEHGQPKQLYLRELRAGACQRLRQARLPKELAAYEAEVTGPCPFRAPALESLLERLGVKGRLGVLLDGVQYSVIPGEQLEIPVVLINQSLGSDTFRLAFEDLPENWTTIPTPALRLEPGEVNETILIVKPPRDPSSTASRYPFHIMVASQKAPDQSVSIDCILTVAAFINFKSSLEAVQADQNLPAQVLVQNLSNIPETSG